MSLTPRMRVAAQIRHLDTDYVPYTLDYEAEVADRLDRHYGTPDWRRLLDNAIRRVPCTRPVVEESSTDYYVDPFGSTWYLGRRPYSLVEPVLKEPSLAGFRFPDPEAIFLPGWQDEALAAIESYRDHFLVAGFGFGLFERSWALRGFNEALMDAAGDPDFYDLLLERVAEFQMEVTELLLQLPVDGIMFSDDWGYQQGILLGPERWRRFLKPRLARMYKRVHAAGKFTLSHCCGSVADVLPDLVEIGLDVLESVQPEPRDMNPYDLKRRFGSQITFWGGLGSQSTIPFGTPAEIHHEVIRLCKEMARNGGYILSPAKALQPETSSENAAAVVEAFIAQGGISFP
jgi:uroporphyrinogen decarboxylase